MTAHKTPAFSFDCIIVGGGLAGLSLAILMARKGYKTALFEKEHYPFHKVCGEYIAMESWPFLAQLGLPLADMDLPMISQLKVSAPNGAFLTQALQPGGFGISRFTLDKALAGIALKEGVHFFMGEKVEEVLYEDEIFSVKAESGAYVAPLVVGSYGKRSNLDIKLCRKFALKPSPPHRNYIGVKYHIKTDLRPSQIELHNFRDGYCGVSKVDGDRYCLCYLTTAANLQNEGSIELLEKNVLMKNPYLKNYFANSTFLYEQPLTISQINFAAKPAVDKHVLMAGDAAGLIAPLCGNGMSMALHSSFLLSGWAAQFLKGEITRAALEENYALHWKFTFSSRLAAGRFIQYMFGRETTSNVMIGVLRHFPKVVSRLEALTHGKPF